MGNYGELTGVVRLKDGAYCKTKNMRVLIFLLLTASTTGNALGQDITIQTQDIVIAKNYPFTFMLKNALGNGLAVGDAEGWQALISSRKERLIAASDSTAVEAVIESFKWRPDEIEYAKRVFSNLWDHNETFQDLIENQLIPTGKYGLGKDMSSKEYMYKALTQDLQAMNFAIDVYGGGKKPNYPKIDSIAFDITSDKYIRRILKGVQEDVRGHIFMDSDYFFTSLFAAVRFLEINERWDAGLLEPLVEGENKLAAAAVRTTDFDQYSYSSIVVLGSGPSVYDQRISPISMLRCRKAALSFSKGLAPFIIVTGGRVHPYKTEFIEAVELKKYLVNVLAVPASSVIIEPQARHTTTNLRNVGRLLLSYGFPATKYAIINSHADNIDMVTRMEKRCLKELGYVPYVLGNRIHAEILEFKPTLAVFTVDSDEPMDP